MPTDKPRDQPPAGSADRRRLQRFAGNPCEHVVVVPVPAADRETRLGLPSPARLAC